MIRRREIDNAILEMTNINGWWQEMACTQVSSRYLPSYLLQMQRRMAHRKQ